MPPGSGKLNTPIGLIFGPDGNLYVSSFQTDSVLRYDGKTGIFLGAFIPAGQGGLNGPYDLTFGPDGNFYVCSRGTSSILRYDGRTGAFIDAFVSSGSGGLNGPNGLVFGPDGNLYVSSWLTNSVLRYDGRTGRFIDTFVPSGSGGLNEPWALAFGPDGSLYVPSAGTDSILRYDGRTGAFLGAFIAGHGLARPDWLLFLPLEAPSSLTAATISSSEIRLSWTDNSDDELGFEIERRIDNGPFSFLAVVGANTTSLSDRNVSPNTGYAYRVRAIDATGRSAFSNEAGAILFVGGQLQMDRTLRLPTTPVGSTSVQSFSLRNVGPGLLAGNVGALSAPFAVLSPNSRPK